MLDNVKIRNKRAKFEYEFLETFTAGIQLYGTEIKSVRLSKASIVEAYCVFVKNELIVRNMTINEYDKGGHYNHESRRDRKLLLNKSELEKLAKKLKNQGLTIVPTLMFISDSGYAKLNIALCKGKKIHDKREDLKSKDAQRSMDRALKGA